MRIGKLMINENMETKSNNRKAIFVISSPLQLLNAIEARDRFHENMETYLFILWKKEIEYKQIDNMLDNKWDKVYFYQLTKVFKLFYYWILKNILKSIFNSDFLYLGYPFNIRAHIANTIKAKKVFFLDDGSVSLIFAKNFKEIKFLKMRRESWYDFLLFRKVSLRYIKEAYFFTAYPEINWFDNKVILNDYRKYKEKIINKESNLDVLFIGSPIGKELVSKLKEKELIRAMLSYFSDKKILYAVHRFENIEYLKKEFSNLEFIQFDSAIELALFQSGIYPQRIASFCSSALITLSHLSNFPPEALTIPLDFLSSENAEKMKVVYESYQYNGIILRHISNGSYI
jgi:hypothetical protein